MKGPCIIWTPLLALECSFLGGWSGTWEDATSTFSFCFINWFTRVSVATFSLAFFDLTLLRSILGETGGSMNSITIRHEGSSCSSQSSPVQYFACRLGEDG